MKINELIAEHQVDEGLGSMIGKGVGALAKGVGATVGGAVGAWDAAKKGYAAGKATVAGDPDPATPPAQGGTPPAQGGTPPAQGGTPPAQGGTPPAQGGTPPAQGGSAPATPPAQGGSAPNSGGIGSIMQAVDKLDPASKKQLAGELEKSIAAPSADAGQDHGLGKQSDGKFIKPGQKFDTASGSPIAQPPANAPAAPEAPPAGGSAPTTPPAGGSAPTTPPAGGSAPTTPPAGGKLTQAQQDAMKAKLQGKRAAGQTTASQTGSGFKDYVGGSQTKLTGADAQGNPVFKKLQRESVAFSNFLGVHI